MQHKSMGIRNQAIRLALILFLVSLIESGTVSPNAITTISGTFETGSAVLTTSSILTNGSFSSRNTTITFLNTYSTTPNFGYGFSYINAVWTQTTSSIETIIDVTPLSSNTASQTLQLNFTTSTVNLFSINYIACVTTFFLDVRTFYSDLVATTLFSSSSSSIRSRTLSLTMKSKSNSSNTIAVYTTIGLSMMRTKNSFDFQLTTLGFTTSGITVNLTVPANNGMRFIRFAIFNYENIVVTVDSPYFIDMGFGANLGGSVGDSSNLGLSTTGTIFMGMTDWAISDSLATILYNMSISGTTYSMDSGNTATRTQTGYIWYRQIVCPTYYYNSSNTCVSCHYSCKSCYSSTATSCSSCDSEAFRSLLGSNSSCPCQSNYYDSGVAICQQIVCPTTCSACSSDNFCSSCIAGTFRTLSNGSCICQSYTTDLNGIATTCLTCYPTCATCSSFFYQNGCLTCNSTKDYRTFNAATSSCICMDGYYEIPNLGAFISNYLYIGAPCRPCQYSCASCITNTSCSSCSSSLKRTTNSATGFCKCMDGFYDSNLRQQCYSCPYSCSTCSSATVCLSCPATRILTNNLCPCQTGYYQVGVAACTACSTNCYTCTNSSTCSSCNMAYSRTMSNGTCICIGGYYDTFDSQICNTCDMTCLTCSGAGANSCSTCDSTKYRQLSLANACNCKSGYYQNSGLVLCATCSYQCATCSDSTLCTTCSALNFRTLVNTSCICNNKYYDDGGNQLCKSCLYFCLTCSSSSICLTCDSSTRNTSNLQTCSCLNGYYDDGISSSCLPCLASCATCNNANNCTSCVTSRQITSLATCSCVARTFEPYCNPCHYSCLSCLGTSSTCTNCNGTAMRYFSSTTSQCLCYQGYYDDGSNQVCGSCHYSCLTCNSSSYCLTCPVNRVINGSYCSCINLYYENSTNLNCLSCHYSCATCSSYSVCTSCSSANFRSLSNSTTLCVCNSGYYDNGVGQTCFACYSICLTCSAFSTCTSCNSTLNFYYSNNTCLCTTGYYFDITTSSCIGCHYSCNSCTGSSSCTTCKENRTLTSTYCACNSGLFDNSITQTCSSCTYPCITCSGASTTCTSCDSTRNLSSNACVCTGATYDTNLNCSSCLSTCQTCTNGAACTTCLTGSYRTLNSNNLCVCPTGYHDENGTQLNCVACNYTCTTCTNSVSCSSCYTGRTAVANSFCVCPTNFYYDNGVNGQCVPCSITCLTCSSISTNCTSCLASTYRQLVNNVCTCKAGYYDDLTNAVCQPCPYSCQQCTGNTSCSVCNATNLRTYTSGPLCSCMPGYFDVSNVQLCSACSYTCLTCISSTTICLTCESTRTLVNTSSSCVCKDGLYDSGSSTCASCLYSCATCNNGTACITCPSTRQLNSFSACQCITSYYDVANLSLCQSCYQACLTCTSYQTCTLCDTQNNYRQLVNTSCLCPAGYYDSSSSGNFTCRLCTYSCATCVSASQCSSCNLNYQRVYNITTSLCSCSPGYYDNINDAPCIICPYDCLTCSNNVTCLTCSTSRYLDSSNRCACINTTFQNGNICESCPTECSTCVNSSSCTSCNANRVLSNSACICSTGLFSVTGTATCSNCHYSCSTCLSSTQCSSCNSTLSRYLTSTYCLCMAGYYDNGSSQACQTCYYSCLLCSNGTTCLTCNSLNNRVRNEVTLLCDCVSGYYEDPITKACIQCAYSCLTCTNGSACTSCNTNYNRALNSSTNQCNCLAIGYFDTYTSIVCSACDYTCLSCNNTATYCTSCLNTTNRILSTSSCVCSNGYYDVTNQVICLTCSYKCVTCSTTSTNCTSCSASSYRGTTPTCACITGYYDDGGNSTCGTCNYVCETCANNLVCSTCNLTVAHRSFNNITLLCDCIAQYYDNGIQICQACSYSCLTCNNPITCLTCPTSRSLTSNQCLCLAKYYDDLINLQCQSCNYTCQTCQNSSSCFSCNSANKRTFNSSSYLCSCTTTYYDVGVQLCSKCDASCYTCTEAASCSSCPPNINKVLNSSSGSNYCVCLYGYYENATAGAALGYNSVCSACYYACATCTGQSTYCTFCSPSSNRYLTTSHQCTCNVGYFQQVGQQTCFPCYTHCLTCTGVNANNCLTCDNTTYYLSNSCYTSCPSFYNISESTRTCVSCPSNCLSCPTSFTVCSQCNSPYFIFITNSSYSQCVLSCPSYYYQLNKTCYSCNSPCLSCTAAYTCTSCINLYYLKDGYCNPCHSLCLTCSGSTALDCITCVSNYVLVSTICQKMTCLSTQYVQSSLGCVNCTATFPNSLSCLSTGPTSCLNGYILSNNSCVTCSSVTGYVYDSSTGKCKDYCGDKIIITDLCDDGNNLNGDGCSSVCTIETGWICPNNSCSLKSSPTVTLVSLNNRAKNNSLLLIISLSVGLRLVDANFILNFSSIKLFTYSSSALNIQYNRYLLVIVYYETAQNNYLTIKIKSPISRLLVTSQTQLSISISVSISVPIQTTPPAIYTSQTQSKVYSEYLFGLLAALHTVLIVFTVIFLSMRLKIMLLIIDSFNSITIIYILAALGLYNVSLLSFQSSRSLQPFVYQFGSPLLDQTTNFYYFKYTSNYFSSTIIQALVIAAAYILCFINSRKESTEDNIWYYYRAGFMFAFAYDFLLSCFSTFFWNTYSSYQSSYSWMFAILAIMYVLSETVLYYGRMRDHGVQGKKVVPAISFITNDLQIRDRTKQDINIFQIQQQNFKERKPSKGILSEWSDQKTEVIGQTAHKPIKSNEAPIMYFDLTPSIQTQYSSKSRNHINVTHLPIMCILFGFLYTIIANIQQTKIRSILFLVISITYLLYVLIFPSQGLKCVRNIKLIVLATIYLILSIISVALSNSKTIDFISCDIVIVTFVILAVVFNIVVFVVSVFKSEAYREYLINKKNEQILERTRKQNEARQKIYTKTDFNKEKSKKPKAIDNNIISEQYPESFEVRQHPHAQIQPTEEQAEQKEFKLMDFKKNIVRDEKTMMQVRDRDSSSIINHQIDNEISDMRESDLPHNQIHADFLNEKNIFDIKRSGFDEIPPSKKIQGSRARAINNSEMSLVDKKGDGSSLFFDSSLDKIDQIRGLKRNLNKSGDKEEVEQKKKTKRKKKPNIQTDVVNNEEFYEREIEDIPKSKIKYYEQEKKQSVQDILQDLQMPQGFKKSGDSNFRARILSIDEISSIKEEREQFMENERVSEYQGSVFNKILQDYKKYRHKKVDKKKLKEIKGKKQEKY